MKRVEAGDVTLAMELAVPLFTLDREVLDSFPSIARPGGAASA